MSNQEAQAPRVMVVGVDYSESSDLAIQRACDLARGPQPAELHVVHVVPSNPPTWLPEQPVYPREPISVEMLSKQLYERVEKVTRDWCATHEAPLPFLRLTTHIRSERTPEAIAQLASDVEAELVIVGTHGRRGARRYLLGSVAEGTVRLAPCAVLVVRLPNASTPQIEPPCPRCVEVRRATNGKEQWCEQHRDHHERRHTYRYRSTTDAHQSGFLIHD